MRKVLLILLSALCLLSAPRSTYGVTVLREPYVLNENNLLHIVSSYALTFTMSSILRKNKASKATSILVPTLITFAVTSLKELLLDPVYNPNDQISNTVGVGLSAVVVLAFDI